MAGNADAYVHKSHVHMTRTASTYNVVDGQGPAPFMAACMSHSRSALTVGSMGEMIDSSKKKVDRFRFHGERRRSCEN